jgi:flagellar secretion chaperone FliS
MTGGQVNPYAAYAEQAATTASPAQLVLMLYDGAIARTETAHAALLSEVVDVGAAHTALTKAQAIVEQLRISLDHEAGGRLADNLAGLYTYCLEGLLQANMTKDAASLDGVLSILTDLRDAWDAACVHGPVGAVAS